MIKTKILKNGLIIICENKKTDKVCMGVLVKTGLLNETDEENGLSHFLEHMAFKGTSTKTAKQLSESIESLGGSCNAYTSNDHTLYYVNMLAKDYKTGLVFLNDIVTNSVFPCEELERERNVILQEIARAKDNPQNVFWERFTQTIYKGQALSRSILGPAKNIKKFKREDLLNYVKKYYCPNNMIVSICGNINCRKAIKFVSSLFKDLKPNKVATTKIEKFIANTKEYKEIFDQAMVAIAYEGPKWGEKDAINAVFSNILDGGMSCRLFQEMREKNGLCYSTSFIADALKDSGYIGIFAGVKEQNVKLALKVMEDTINTMKTAINDEEMEKAKNIALYHIAGVMENCEATMNYNVIRYMYKNQIPSIKKYIKDIKKVTKQDVLRFANDYINEKRISKIIITHKKVNKSK